MRKLVIAVICVGLFFGLLAAKAAYAQGADVDSVLISQELGPVGVGNFVKYAIKSALVSGVSASTIVLLLLLPLIAFFIALARNVIGIRGFGILLPAALSVVFVAIGPIVGVGLFLVIVATSLFARIALRKLNLKLGYLPRMALILWLVVVAILAVFFLAPRVNYGNLATVSVFPVLILALLAEDFTRVQLGKSVRTAISLTSETLILSFASFLLLTLRPVQEFALMNPEILLLGVAAMDLLLGRYSGLRVLEIWRFRKLITS